MQDFPAFAEPTLPASGRGERQRDEQDQAEQADAHGWTFAQIAPDQFPFERIFQVGIGKQVKTGKEEAINTERASGSY